LPRAFPHKTYRFAGISLVLIVAIFAIIGESFSRHYKGLIMERLPALSAKATDSLYDITVQDIRINIFTQAVTVHGLRMSVNLDVLQLRRAQGRPPHVVLDVTVPEADIRGIRWNDLAAERSLSCRTVRFHRPEIRVQIMPEWQNRDTLGPAVPAAIRSVHAQRIFIEEPQLDVRYGYGEEGFSIQAMGGDIQARDWDFHPHEPFDTARFFAAKEAEISLTGITYTYPGALYRYSMRDIRFSTKTGAGLIDDLRIRPAMSYEEMYARIGHRRDIYECHLPEVKLYGLDWRSLLARHTFTAERLDLDDADLSIHLSKRPPVSPQVGLGYYPHQWLLRLGMPLSIRWIYIWDGAVRYSETNGKTGATGALLFNYLRGTIYNVTNRPEEIARAPLCRTLIGGKFMYRTDIAAVIDLALNSRKGAFALNGRIRGLDAAQIREPVRAMAIADVSSLHIPDARVQIAGNEDSTWGRFTIRYNDLKLKLKKWNEVDSDVHSRVFLTFLANKVLLYSDNPMPGDAVRTVVTGVPRGEVRSLFPILWKNIFQACMLTAIRDEGAFDMVKRKAANKGKPKRKFFKGLFPKRTKPN
jgi:hypothetical protein